MTMDFRFNLSLKLHGLSGSSEAGNTLLTTWPPEPNFPVMSIGGDPLSLYGDSVWHLSPWFGGKRVYLNFGDDPNYRGNFAPISVENAWLLRRLVAFWLYRDEWKATPGSVKSNFDILRSIFVHCSNHGVRVDELVAAPELAHGLASVVFPSRQHAALRLLERISAQRRDLGFSILDAEGLRRFRASITKHQTVQTPCIPPRIWSYQAARVYAFMADYLRHKDGIEALFRYCLDAYIEAFGSAAGAYRREEKDRQKNPFNASGQKTRGSFAQVARLFGVEDLLLRWIGRRNNKALSIRQLQKYMTTVTQLGVLAIADHSQARLSEVLSMRSDCLVLEDHPDFGRFYLVKGLTSKARKKPELVHWVVGPEIEGTVEAMSHVAGLRMYARSINPYLETGPESIKNPRLATPMYEPWHNGNGLFLEPNGFNSLEGIVEELPIVFDEEVLRITSEDLASALYMTPELPPGQFAEDLVWPLGFHQLRRTGAVYMYASGDVSHDSVRLQLKQRSPAMALIYGRGHSELKLDSEVTDIQRRAMFEMVARQFTQLKNEHYFSPFGSEHKSRLLAPLKERDLKGLEKDASKGTIRARRVALGACLNCEDCPLGGIESVVGCIGSNTENACAHVLVDQRRLPDMEEALEDINDRLGKLIYDSPLKSSLASERASLEKAIDLAKRNPS
jgi:hypothetical protein